MLRAGNKHPLGENPGENSSAPRRKRSRFDNIVLLNENGWERSTNSDENNGSHNELPRRILRAGKKRKKPTYDEEREMTPSSRSQDIAEPDENDIISQLTKEFKKARLRPVFFTISTFIEQTVDEVGFTVDEPETEVTIRLNLTKKNVNANESKPSEEGVEKGTANSNSDEAIVERGHIEKVHFDLSQLKNNEPSSQVSSSKKYFVDENQAESDNVGKIFSEIEGMKDTQLVMTM